MSRLLTIFTFCMFAAGAPAVFGQTIKGEQMQPTGQHRPTPQPQPQKAPDAGTPYDEAVAFMKAKNYAAAVPKFEAALKANPNLLQAHLLAAFCLRRLGPANYAASLQHCNAALKLNPQYGEALESRGVLYVKMGRKEDAQKDLATLKQVNPKLAPGLEVALKTGNDVDHY